MPLLYPLCVILICFLYDGLFPEDRGPAFQGEVYNQLTDKFFFLLYSPTLSVNRETTKCGHGISERDMPICFLTCDG